MDLLYDEQSLSACVKDSKFVLNYAIKVSIFTLSNCLYNDMYSAAKAEANGQ